MGLLQRMENYDKQQEVGLPVNQPRFHKLNSGVLGATQGLI